jgi:ATP-dependent Clp protease ATP-binding subunit ClpX
MENVRLTFPEEALRSISRKAIQRKTGARGLRSIMESILLDTMFELPSMHGVEEIVVSSDVVDGRAQPLQIYAERRNGQESAG